MNNFFRTSAAAAAPDAPRARAPASAAASPGNANNNNNPRGSFVDRIQRATQDLGQAARSSVTAAQAAAAVVADAAGFDPNAIRRAMEASVADQQTHHEMPSKIPPASAAAIKDLPLVTVTPQDLLDRVNRECCICMESLEINSQATRLPCAHIFDCECIQDWLRRSCTCPVCRYELPTNNAEYEPGRLHRMALRKPRFAQHQYQQLSTKELKQLQRRSATAMKYRAVDKADLMQHLVQCGVVDLIAAPDPVEYPLSVLQKLSVRELRQCMNEEAGVFFDPKDVIEKSDMIRIFINSGRLLILAEQVQDGTAVGENDDDEQWVDDPMDVDEDEDEFEVEAPYDNGKPYAVDSKASAEPLVETVSEDSDEEADGVLADDRLDTTLIMEENLNYESSLRPVPPAVSSSRVTDTESSVPVDTDSVASGSSASSENGSSEASNGDTASPTVVAPGGNASSETGAVHTAGVASVTEPVAAPPHAAGLPAAGAMDDDAAVLKRQCQRSLADDIDISSSEAESPPHQNAVNGDAISNINTDNDNTRSTESNETPIQHQEELGVRTRFVGVSISGLRELAREASVDLVDCIERQEMVDRLANSSRHSARSGNVASLDDGNVADSGMNWDGWGVSDILAFAKLVNVDLSRCKDRDEMTAALQAASRDRPAVAQYQTTLAPLALSTVSQLRAAAREWRVDVSDCLEKGDLFHRLVIAGGARNENGGP